MKNPYVVDGDTVEIIIKAKNGDLVRTKIDFSDLEKVNGFGGTWRVHWEKSTDSYYVVAKQNKKDLRLHRFITDAPKGMLVDHINHDSLDNRRENLRVVTAIENQQNRKGAQKNNKTGIRGVSYIESEGRYMGRIRVNKKIIHVGSFKTSEEAGKAVEEARQKHFIAG